jgi:hypothetical protein
MPGVYQINKKIYFLFIGLIISTIAVSQTVTDTEIKKNVTEINASLQKLAQLNPKTFEYETDKYKHLKLEPGIKFGFMAEEIQQVFPHMVHEKNVSYMFGKNTYRYTKIKTIDEGSLIPVLVAAIQQQQRQIEKLTLEVETLKDKRTSAAR